MKSNVLKNEAASGGGNALIPHDGGGIVGNAMGSAGVGYGLAEAGGLFRSRRQTIIMYINTHEQR